jgi:hypothetical protein
MVSLEGIGQLGAVEPIERSGRVASDDTAAIGVARHSARAQIQIEGNRDLGEKVLRLTAIVG